MRRALALGMLAALPLAVGAQGTPPDTAHPPSACWRFAFGEWSPPLDWQAAGHAGDSARAAASVERVRDSVFVKDSVATHANTMTIQYTKDGMLVMLYPFWWPAGVKLTFDSTAAGGREMFGTAVALVANGGTMAPRARAKALQVGC